MAGYTPPKSPDRRARRNKDSVQTRVFAIDPADPYELPEDLLPEGDDWHPATLRWWQRWCESPLAAELPAVDWSELEACAVLHHQFMKKRSFALASELRLRMSAFGATPLDRARLRYQVASADQVEDAVERGRTADGGSARERYSRLRVVGGSSGSSED